MILKKIGKWFADITGETEIRTQVNAALDERMKFVLGLTDRERNYYMNLHDSWRKELTRLEKRVYELEQKE